MRIPFRDRWCKKLLLEALEDRLLLATYTVSNTSDSGPGSFRQAIIDADQSQASSIIQFRITAGGVQTLAPQSAYPALTVPVTIDGTTEQGYFRAPLIVIDGINTTADYGIDLAAGNSTIRGLVVQRFPNAGIGLLGSGRDKVVNCYVGTDQQGTRALGNGVGIYVGSNGNTIGGTANLAELDLISANRVAGIKINNASNNAIVYSYIGTDVNGTIALANGIGIAISSGTNNFIGRTDAVMYRNVISGNTGNGIDISGASTGNTILANSIGTDSYGWDALANGGDGIAISGQSGNNTVGGTSWAASNVISGNRGAGIDIIGGTIGNQVLANIIGADFIGLTAIPNTTGISIVNGTNNRIGAQSWGNLISGNSGDGIYLTNSSSNTIVGNWIGTDFGGDSILRDSHGLPYGNRGDGIHLSAGSNNNSMGVYQGLLINVIGGNSRYGVEISGSSGNVLAGNLIGTGGLSALPNGTGILLSNATGTIIGSIATHGFNVISGNTGDGVEIFGGSGNQIQKNTIGLDVVARAALPNGGNGVVIAGGAVNNIIGGSDRIPTNVISGNNGSGIYIHDAATQNNSILNNVIGTDFSGTIALANKLNGIHVAAGSTRNTIGGVAQGQANIIWDNGNDGVLIDTGGLNAIRANSIFGHHAGQAIHLLNGANNSMPSPVLTNVVTNNGTTPVLTNLVTNSGTTTITFVFNYANLPNTAVTFDFFASPTGNTQGPGEGKTFLGFKTVMTNGAGFASGSVTFTGTVGLGPFFTATATDPSGNTSPYSASFQSLGPNAEDGVTLYPDAGNQPGNSLPASYDPATEPLDIAQQPLDLQFGNSDGIATSNQAADVLAYACNQVLESAISTNADPISFQEINPLVVSMNSDQLHTSTIVG
jgi:hypothetical protein